MRPTTLGRQTRRQVAATRGVVALLLSLACIIDVRAADPALPRQLIGYTELRTNLPGGRHANARTMRAAVVQVDGSGRRLLADELAREPETWTQFAGWSPDGGTAIINRGWQSPENAQWEEEHQAFRMEPGKWLLDSHLLHLATGKIVNVTAVDRVSHYNGGLFFLPAGRGLGFTPLIGGVSKPFVMDLDGRNKRDVSGKDAGFAYGYSAAPDGKLISYHENYQLYVAQADGSNKKHIKTGNPFDFGPRWSPEGQWLLFVSGMHGRSNPYVIHRDGTGLRKLADLNGYQGSILFLDVADFHQGSSDLPVWSSDGKSVFYTAKTGSNVELFQTTLDGTINQLTKTPEGTLHYHPEPSPDGQWLLYGSKRDGVRQLFVMRLADRFEQRLTDLKPGHAAMWPHWQPVAKPPISVGLHKQLFVDDFIVAEKSGVARELGQVTKSNGGKPIFTDGWFYGTVLHDEGRFKLWYRKPGNKGFGYAESRDGIAFEKKADLMGINFAGDFTLAIEVDPHEKDPQHRYKAGYDAPGMAAGIAHSADGVAWAPYNGGKPVTSRAADTYNQLLWDPVGKTYRLFTRTDFGTAGGAAELRGTRSMTNTDLKTNPKGWKLVREWIFDREGEDEPKRRQIYAATCWIYEGMYFALLSVYEYPGDVSEGKTTDTRKRHERDVMNLYIASSRDGDSWDLQWVYAGRPLVPRGPDGAFDKDLVLSASTIVTHADKHWIYYAGGNERHGTERVRFDRQHAIGLATLRLDGFVSLTAEKRPGTVVSKPFRLEGDRLLVNVDASVGSVSIELLNEAGKPIPEYSGDAAGSGTRIDELRWQPRWKERTDLSGLKNQTVRLKFTLQNARLYSFQVR